ncbi:MAG: glycine betaine ABC transporter substrate-binding protein [Leucobacter sp.]
MKKRHLTGALALAASMSLVLAGCAAGAEVDSDSKGTIKVGYVPAWADAITTAYLLEDQLEKIGYEVELEQIGDAALLYTAVAEGDIDIYSSAWPERTQIDYWEKYGDELESLSTYYDQGIITLAVPDYVDITSLEELADHADEFDNRIVGIEPGAGQMKVTEEDAMPAYGLDNDFELLSSSVATMLISLEEAIENQEPIVVTMWRPFWGNVKYDMRDLEDPKGALGEAEGLHMIATKGFSEKYPEAADLISGLQLEDEAYSSLENRIMNDFKDNEAEGVSDWLKEFPDAFDTIVTD